VNAYQPPKYFAQWRVSLIASALGAGKVVVCPAEGVLGLSCDPFDQDAVLALLQMKQRPVSKGLILVAADIEPFMPVLESLTTVQRDTLLASWPGPNTWLVPHCNYFPAWVTGSSDQVAIRVTSAPALQALCSQFGGALVSTSANPAGRPPAHANWQLRRYFGRDLPSLPGGLDPVGKASTIRRVADGSVVRA